MNGVDADLLVPTIVRVGVDAPDLARDYYDAIDGDDYDRLGELLAAAFVHERPDRTIEGRRQFVQFMRDERPQRDTEHVVDGVYEGADGVAVRGRLFDENGDEWFAFVDVFRVEDRRIRQIRTYVE